MRKIAGSSNYLKNQTRKYLSRAILSLLLFILIFTLTAYSVIFKTQNINKIDIASFIIALIFLLTFRYYQHKYNVYKGGRQGEKTVIKTLTSRLDDEYYLLNGVYLKSGGGGDIDHIVLGPTGVYVLETKNWSGKIFCNGNHWQRPGKKVKRSPSLQVKNNTQKIKKIIDTSPISQRHNIWVEGLIAFTNKHANLSISNPTVTVLRIQQLPDYIKNQKGNRLTKEQIQQITKQIQNA
jgi:hypothetical protein